MAESRDDIGVGQWIGELVGQLLAYSHAFENVDVVFVGELPYLPTDLAKLLPPTAKRFLNDLPGEVVPDFVVIGQQSADESLLDKCMDASYTDTRYLPHIAFIDQAIFGYDWWASQVPLLNHACVYYPGLEYVRAHSADQSFDWPSVEATPVPEPTGADEEDREETELHKRGYDVKKGRSRENRWLVLTRIIDGSEMTLEQVAGTMAWYCRNFRRQFDGENKYSRALGEWEFDLQRLKATYYEPRRNRFSWPSTRP
jgi:hypothetical protein